MADELDLPALHGDALAHTQRIVDGIADDAWGLPTPCEDWDVREVLNHVVAGNWWAARLAAGETIAEVGDELDGDMLGDDPRAAYRASVEPAATVFERPGAMDAPAAVSYGPVPGSVYAGHRFLDVLIHGWDLAVGSGQDTTLPPDLVEACRRVVEPQLDMLAGSGMFGDGARPDHVEPGQDALLKVLGRSPA